MYERFDRIYKSDTKKGISIEEKYSLTLLRKLGRFVVWYKDRIGEGVRPEHRVYDSLAAFVSQYGAMKENEKLFHEVIFSDGQKLKFDIDMKRNPREFVHGDMATVERICRLYGGNDVLPHDEFDDGAVDEFESENGNVAPELVEFEKIINYIINKIKQEFYFSYEIDLRADDFLICSSSRVGQKYSAHIVLPRYCVSGYKQAAEFTDRMVRMLPRGYRDLIDVGVNRAVQNFRLTGSHNGDGRVKTIVGGMWTFEDSVISNIGGCEMLNDIVSDGGNNDDNNGGNKRAKMIETKFNEADIAAAVAIASGATVGHVMRCVRGGLITYDRVAPTYCDLCIETHHSDHTLMLSLVAGAKTVQIFMHCRHAGRGNKILVGEFVPSDSSVLFDSGGWLDGQIRRAIECGDFDSTDARDRRIMKYDVVNEYCEAELREFELVDTLVVRAAMKMGKTKTLKRYIDRWFAVGGIEQPRIRIVSFRQTFSNNLKEKFPDFVLYSDVVGDLVADRLIVQIESLHRLRVWPGSAGPDLLVLDECESILEQFNGGLIRNNDCFAKFMYLLKNSRHVVCMDALAGMRTYNVLRRLRGGALTLHCNLWRNAVEDRYIVTGDQTEWLREMFGAIGRGEKIAVPISSLKVASEIYKMIGERFPNLNVKLYSSGTRMSEKRTHLQNVGFYWKQYDVIIYTPTISAGVSFEERHFDRIFGLFTDRSCPVETCIQMMGRVRDVGTKTYNLCLLASGGHYPCTDEEIRREVNDTRSSLYLSSAKGDNSINMAVATSYDANGQMDINVTPFYDVWVENIKMINDSRNRFIAKFIGILRGFGSSVQQMEIVAGVNDTTITREVIKQSRGAAKKSIAADLSSRIVGARDGDDEEVREIKAVIDGQGDLSVEQQNVFDRWQLRQDYGWRGEINEGFVNRYFAQSRRKVYRNVRAIFGTGKVTDLGDPVATHDEALELIRRDEYNVHRYYIASGQEQRDLLREYMYAAHRAAIALLRALGWRWLGDTAQIDDATMFNAFASNMYKLAAHQAAQEFKIEPPMILMHASNKQYAIGKHVSFVNKIFTLMYGIKVREAAKRGEFDEAYYRIGHMNGIAYEFGLENNIKIVAAMSSAKRAT